MVIGIQYQGLDEIGKERMEIIINCLFAAFVEFINSLKTRIVVPFYDFDQKWVCEAEFIFSSVEIIFLHQLKLWSLDET